MNPGPNDCKELTVLKRVWRWTDDGLEYEADPRQCERLLEGLGLDDNCNGAATPGLKPLPAQIETEGFFIVGGPVNISSFVRTC